MAPLPPDNTARYRVKYTNIGIQHVMDIRSTQSPSAFGTEVDAFLTALSPVMKATVIDSVEFAAHLSNIFNVVVSGIEGNTYGSGAGVLANASQYADFVGRSTGGRRVRLAVFGIPDTSNDFRYLSSENADIDATIAVLNGAGNTFLCIDGLAPIWKNYANAGQNAHWQRALRP
jgi:hypothetical protein